MAILILAVGHFNFPLESRLKSCCSEEKTAIMAARVFFLNIRRLFAILQREMPTD
jgi:hypothetical protein